MTFPLKQSFAHKTHTAAAAGPESLRVGSICSGYEGLGMAVQSVLGGELAWVADNDPGASAILAHRFPSVPNLHDITSVDWATTEPVDIFTAGFPCQPVSNAGKRLGEADERWIWPDVARAIRDLRPGLVVLENVAALVARGLPGVTADLAAIGYVGSWRCIRASDVGAPHARNRVFITAWPAADTAPADERWRGGSRGPAEPAGWPEPDDRRGPAEDADGAASGEWREPAPGQTPGRWPRADAGGSGGAPATADARSEGLEVGAVEHHGPQLPAAERGRGDAPADANGSGWWPEPGPDGGRGCGGLRAPGCEPGDSPGGSAVGEVLRILGWGAYAPAIGRWEAVVGRPAPKPTEPGRTGERLSPRFVEWMMGLPDGWVTDVPRLTRNAQLKALGNGVVPQQAAAALRVLLPALERAA